MWLKKLKIAIVEENTTAISKLMEEIPKLTDKAEIEEALFLLKSADKLISSLKNTTNITMQQMRKNIDFLKSTQAPKKNNFDKKY